MCSSEKCSLSLQDSVNSQLSIAMEGLTKQLSKGKFDALIYSEAWQDVPSQTKAWLDFFKSLVVQGVSSDLK